MTPQERAIWESLCLIDQLLIMGPVSRAACAEQPGAFPVCERYYFALDEIAAGRDHEWVLDNEAWYRHTGVIPQTGN
jgi:hypothetical protein